jgi:hypothetical protein
MRPTHLTLRDTPFQAKPSVVYTYTKTFVAGFVPDAVLKKTSLLSLLPDCQRRNRPREKLTHSREDSTLTLSLLFLLATRLKMANITRSAKPGSDWSEVELIAYNITVDTQPPQDFFRTNAEVPLDDIDPSLINSTRLHWHADGVTDKTCHFLAYLDLATNSGHESFLSDFPRETLRVLGFEERGLALATNFSIPLTICGDGSPTAQALVCLVAPGSIILLIY